MATSDGQGSPIGGASSGGGSPREGEGMRKKKSKKGGSGVQYVEVRVAGIGLKGRKVCPFAVLLRAGASANVWQEAARTEVVYQDADPGFVTPFEIGNDETGYRVALYSRTGQSEEVNRCAFLGYAEFTVERMLRKDDGVIERVLRSRRGKADPKRGRLVLCGELVDVPRAPHTFSIRFGFGANSGVWGPMDGLRKTPRKAFYVGERARGACVAAKRGADAAATAGDISGNRQRHRG